MPAFRLCVRLSLAALSALICTPAAAEPETFHGDVRIVAPAPDQKGPRRVSGTVIKEGGTWRMTLTHARQQPASGGASVEFDSVNRKAAVINQETGLRTELEFGLLEAVKWSEIPQTVDSLGAFFTVGSSLKQKAHFIRNTIFQKHPVQEYSFTENKETFGRLFYSVEYGIPLKIDVFGARGTHALIVVENVRR